MDNILQGCDALSPGGSHIKRRRDLVVGVLVRAVLVPLGFPAPKRTTAGAFAVLFRMLSRKFGQEIVFS